MALPLCAAAAALLLIALRARELLFRAALDGPAFARELKILLGTGQDQAARELAQRLRPAWAAELAARALATRGESEEQRYALDEAWAELELAAQRGLLALRSLGRLELPLALAIAIVEIGSGFGAASADRGLAASHAIGRGLFAVSVGMAASIACQVGYGVLARAAKQRLAEARSASDALSG
ncbi:MAG TPA: hypothetical protein VJR89_08925 [Polyangiales bacterium]|nr:hypothetical protein [Polyangiales bacterium]